MKTIEELMELVSQACTANANRDKISNAELFVEYSPHVNQISFRFFMTGWKKDAIYDECKADLGSSSGVQEAYWFLHNRISYIF